MSAALGGSLVFLGLVAVTLVLLIVRLWRGESKVAETLEIGFAATPFRGDVKHGMVRGIVPLAAQIVFIIATVVSAVAGMSSWHGGTKLTPLMLIALANLIAMLVAFVLHFSVIYFNRPRWLVPPFMRHEPGVIEGRRQVARMEPPSTPRRTGKRK